MLVLLSVISNAKAAAYKWHVQPDVTVAETYSDNALFAPSSTRRSDLITQVTPGLRIDGKGPRLSAYVAYTPSVLFYRHNRQEDRIANVLTAFGSLEAFEKLLFVDLNANINQSFVSPFRAQPSEVTTVTPNRTETRTYGVSPYLIGQLGSELSYELRDRSIWTSARSDALPDVQLQQWSGSIAKAKDIIGWAFQYEDTRIRYDNPGGSLDQESTLWRGRLFLEPDPGLRFSVSGGDESNNYLRLAERKRYGLYGAGMSWKPSRRTSAQFEEERRFFGASRLALFSHRTRLTAWTLAYSRNASSYQQELLRAAPGNTAGLLEAIFAAHIEDPIERRSAVQDFLRTTGTPAFLASSLSFYTQQIFLEERREASAAILGKRNFATLTAFRSTATALSETVNFVPSDAFALGRRIVQYGVGVDLNHRITPFTAIGADARRTYTRREEPPTDASRNDYLALKLSRALSPKTLVFTGLSVSQFRSATTDKVTARSVFAGLNHRF